MGGAAGSACCLIEIWRLLGIATVLRTCADPAQMVALTPARRGQRILLAAEDRSAIHSDRESHRHLHKLALRLTPPTPGMVEAILNGPRPAPNTE